MTWLAYMVWGTVLHVGAVQADMEMCEQMRPQIERIWRLGTARRGYRVIDGKRLSPNDMTVECRQERPIRQKNDPPG